MNIAFHFTEICLTLKFKEYHIIQILLFVLFTYHSSDFYSNNRCGKLDLLSDLKQKFRLEDAIMPVITRFYISLHEIMRKELILLGRCLTN